MRPPSDYCDALPNGRRCKDDDTIPTDVMRRYEVDGRWCDCFVYARVTYRAGVAQCLDCQVSTPQVVRSGDHQELQAGPDAITQEALDAVPYFITVLLRRGQEWTKLVPNLLTIEDEAIELLSRAYQVVWHAFTEEFGTRKEETNVQIAVKMSQAYVSTWRVGLWSILHFIVLLLGIAFVILQSRSNHPWMRNPPFAALLLNTRSITKKLTANGIDPWKGDVSNLDGMFASLAKEAGDVDQPRRIELSTLENVDGDEAS